MTRPEGRREEQEHSHQGDAEDGELDLRVRRRAPGQLSPGPQGAEKGEQAIAGGEEKEPSVPGPAPSSDRGRDVHERDAYDEYRDEEFDQAHGSCRKALDLSP
jgi:hypothetical protein